MAEGTRHLSAPGGRLSAHTQARWVSQGRLYSNNDLPGAARRSCLGTRGGVSYFGSQRPGLGGFASVAGFLEIAVYFLALRGLDCHRPIKLTGDVAGVLTMQGFASSECSWFAKEDR